MSDITRIIDGYDVLDVASFELESGHTLRNVPVAYRTWGSLNQGGDNVLIVCHGFTGTPDVGDWWGLLMGRGKALDSTRFFIFCANVLGSPYGTASPTTINPETGEPFGPEFPITTIRDDVRLHKIVLDHLGVSSVVAAIGGSMGGMAVLEWPLCTPRGFIRHIVPIATSARYSAWCISWGEAQRQSIYSDPVYDDGYYTSQPVSGLAAARMAALLTYRSRDSYERRFGRTSYVPQNVASALGGVGTYSPHVFSVQATSDEALHAHNNGHRNARRTESRTSSRRRLSSSSSQTEPSSSGLGAPSTSSILSTDKFHPFHSHIPKFSVQSYLRYQGSKFTTRFDANCYIHLTWKMDTHDISRGRVHLPSNYTQTHADNALAYVLRTVPPKALVIGIQSDGLFTPNEQEEIAKHVPEAELAIIPSMEGHDAFLLEFEEMNWRILEFLRRVAAEYYAEQDPGDRGNAKTVDEAEANFNEKRPIIFSAEEADITNW